MLDWNTRVLVLHLDDQTCIIRLGALHDPTAKGNMGAALFTDVRVLDIAGDEGPFNFWAREQLGDGWVLQMDSTDYLTNARQRDPQRPADYLQDHYHFFVPDGNHHYINIVARGCAMTVIPSPPGDGLASLLTRITPFDWLA
jgi:hypothetical protein